MTVFRLKSDSSRGFTLVETLVSLAIFSMVMVVAGGIILSLISSNRQNQAVNVVVNNLNNSIESMVRDIKTGFEYKCDYTTNPSEYTIDKIKDAPGLCDPSGQISNITLISTITGEEVVVRYDFVRIGGGPGYIIKTVYEEDGMGIVTAGSPYPLTDSTNIDITQMDFRVIEGTPLYNAAGELNFNPVQPGVFLLIKGTAKVNAINISDFFIQTFISQRLPNFI